MQSLQLNTEKISSALDTFHDSFASLDLTTWQTSVSASDAVAIDGNVAGAEYLKLTKSSLLADTISEIISKKFFKLPARVSIGYSLSQRIAGEEHYMELVALGSDGNPDTTNAPSTPVITVTSILVTTNVALVQCSAPITGLLNALDRVVLYGFADSRLNVGAVSVTSIYPSLNQFTIPLTIANGTYGGGSVIKVDPLKGAANACSFLFDGITTANAIPVTRNDGGSPLIGAATSFGTAFSDATQASSQPYAYGAQPKYNTEFLVRPDSLEFISQASDSLSIGVGFSKRSQSVPNPDKNYAVRFRSKNLPNKSVPVANIVSVSKTGTTTATVTTDVAHGLTTSDWVWALGTKDTINFAPLAVATQIASVIDATHFTIVWGAAATATSWGGTIIRINGGSAPSAQAQVIRGIARSGNGYMMVASSTDIAVLVGDTIRLIGVADSAGNVGVDGRYKVAHITPAIWNTASLTISSAVVTGIADTSLLAVGAHVTGTGIPALALILSIQPGVGFTMSAVATATTAGVTITQTGIIVEAIGAAYQPSPAGLSMGGTAIKETDFRVNFVKVFDFNRTPVEVVGGYNGGDAFNSAPVSVVNAGNMAISSVAVVSTVTTVATLTNAAQIGAVPANSFILDQMHNAWANIVRRLIQ